MTNIEKAMQEDMAESNKAQATPPATKQPILTQAMSDHLYRIRDTGEVNMYGAGAYLERDFGLSRYEAQQALREWIEPKKAKQETPTATEQQLLRQVDQLEEKMERLYRAADEAIHHVKECSTHRSYCQAREWIRNAMAGKKKWRRDEQ